MFVCDFVRVVLVVEVLEFRKLIDALLERFVALLRKGQPFLLTLFLRNFRILIRGISVQFHDFYIVDRDVAMFRGIEPPSPEPIEIDPRSIFHRSKEIRWHRTLELPATRIFTERKIEKISTENRLSQNIEPRGRFAVSVRTKLHDRITVGHDRHLIRALHVGDHELRITTLRWVLIFPLLLGKVL